MIRQMISLEPGTRPTFDTLLHTSRGTVFPESFYSFLHNYVSSVNDLPNPPPFSLVSPQSTPATLPSVPHAVGSTRSTSISTVGTTALPAAQPSSSDSGESLPSDSDHRIERIWADYESVEPYLVPDIGEGMEETVKIDSGRVEYGTSTPFQDVLPVELHIPNRDSKLRGTGLIGRRAATEGGHLLCTMGLNAYERFIPDGSALIILALLAANVRNCSLPSSKVRALDVFLALSSHLTDEAKLDRMVPYIVDLLHDDAAVVRGAALRTLMQVVGFVYHLSQRRS